MPRSFFARLVSPMNGYNFTERVRHTLARARERAAQLHHEYVGTEHMLLALLDDDRSVAIAALDALGVDRVRVADTIARVVRPGSATASPGPDLPYTSRAKKVLELAMSAARDLHHSYVGSEHLLVGLVEERTGIAAQALADQGVTPERITDAVVRLLGAELPHGAAAPPPAPSPAPRAAPLDPPPQEVVREQLAWTRLLHALDVTARLGTTPTIDLADDGTLAVSLGPDLVVRVAFPPSVGLERRSPRAQEGD